MAKQTKSPYVSSLESTYGKKGPPRDVNDLFAKDKDIEYVDLPDDVIDWDNLEDDIPFVTKKEDNVLQLPAPSGHRVSVIADTLAPSSELYLHIFVPGPNWEARSFAKIFSRAYCWKAKTVDEADLVIFPGGADVDPTLYGERPHSTTHSEARRDTEEMELYLHCLENGIPMLGICRGAQFLHVMNGGKLFQDIDNHHGPHDMYDLRNRKIVHRVSSVHHQACRANVAGGMEILATASRSEKRWLNDTDYQEGKMADIEAFWYRETACIGIQGHPEYDGYGEFTNWTFKLIDDLINSNPDLAYIDKRIRMKPEFRAGAGRPAEDPVTVEAEEVVTVPKVTSRKPRAKKENAACAA